MLNARREHKRAKRLVKLNHFLLRVIWFQILMLILYFVSASPYVILLSLTAWIDSRSGLQTQKLR